MKALSRYVREKFARWLIVSEYITGKLVSTTNFGIKLILAFLENQKIAVSFQNYSNLTF